MTSILNFSSTSSAQAGSAKDDSTKFPTTFIVQPQHKTNSLLAKRCKPVDLGDMLMKKLKTSSGSNSSDQSPVLKSSFDDAGYESSEVLECHSAIEAVRSPSSHLSSQDANKMNDETTVPECLIPQRSFSTPIIPTALSFGAAKNKVPDGQKQLQNALETLQKRMLLEQQAIIIRDIIKRVQFSQDILRIPALNSESNVESPCNAEITREQLKKVLTRGEEDPEIIIGEIEYPLLSMAPPSTNSKRSALGKINPPKRGKKANAKNSLCSSPDSEDDDDQNNDLLLDSLTVTRAETQRSDSEVGESFAKVVDGGKKRGRKAAQEPAEKPKKNTKKEKAGRQANNKGLLSPLIKERKMTERKKNKWQDTELNVKVF